jgi:hypothetical protein
MNPGRARRKGTPPSTRRRTRQPPPSRKIAGDTLSDFGDGLEIQLGGRKHMTGEDVAQRLRPLLDLPVELVLPAHGAPTDRAALERALS